MRTSNIGVRSELGSIIAPRLAMAAAKHVHISIAGQQGNGLLHDGHAWKDFARKVLTRCAIHSSRTDLASILVHAGFAFVDAVERGAVLTDPSRSAVDATVECEALALSGPVALDVILACLRSASWIANLITERAGWSVPGARYCATRGRAGRSQLRRV